MDRIRPLLLMTALLAGPGLASAGEPERRAKITDSAYLRLYVARDDGDDDGIADAEASRVRGRGAKSVLWLDAKPPVAVGAVDGDSVRLLDGERPFASVAKGQRFAKLGVQGARAGTSRIQVNGKLVELQVVDVVALDAGGERVDLARSHASLSRVLPRGLGPKQKADADPDALRWILIGPSAALPIQVEIESRRPDGAALDALGPLALRPHACPEGTAPGLDCRATALIRATTDAVDRSHPES
jgi:hypothetical protein